MSTPDQLDFDPTLNRKPTTANRPTPTTITTPVLSLLNAVYDLHVASGLLTKRSSRLAAITHSTKLVAAVGSGRIAIPDLTNQIEQLTNQLFRLEHEIYRLTPHLPIAQNHAPEDETDFVKPDSSSLKLTIRACRHCLGPKPEQPDTEYTDSR